MVHAPEPIVPESEIARLGIVLRRYFRTRAAAPEVDDLVQDVFVQLHKRRSGGVVADINRYIFVVAGNVLMRRHKRERRWQRAFVEDVWDTPAEASPERALMSKQELDGVVEALRAMPQRTREIFLLHRFGEMTYIQIAQSAGISVSAVEKHIIRALKALRRHEEESL